MPPDVPPFCWQLLAVVSALADALLLGFVPTVGLLLAGRWLRVISRPLLGSLTTFNNTLLLAGALLFMLAAAGYGASRVTNGDEYEQYAFINQLTGPYWFAYWGAVLSKGLLPQLLWLKRLRRSLGAGLALVPFLLVDYWLPLLYAAHRDYLPASWAMRPDWYALAALGLGYSLPYALLFAVAWQLGLLAPKK